MLTLFALWRSPFSCGFYGGIFTVFTWNMKVAISLSCY